MSVAFDTGSSAQPFSNVSSVTWTHTASGSNRYVRVSVGWVGYPSTSSITGVTYNGVSMTSSVSVSSGGFAAGSQNGCAQIWELINPPTGSQTIVVSFSDPSYGVAGSESFNNVNQSTATGNTGTNNGNSSGPIVTISSSSGNMVSDCFFANFSSGLTPTPNNTLIWSGQERPGSGYTAGSQYASGASSVQTSWSLSTSLLWVACSAELLQVVASSIVQRRTMSQLGTRVGSRQPNTGPMGL